MAFGSFSWFLLVSLILTLSLSLLPSFSHVRACVCVCVCVRACVCIGCDCAQTRVILEPECVVVCGDVGGEIRHALPSQHACVAPDTQQCHTHSVKNSFLSVVCMCKC